MDYKDIIKVLTNVNPNPDKTSLISALSSGGDMSALLPFLMKSVQKNESPSTVRQSDGQKIELPSDDELKEALLKLNETQNMD